MFFPLLREKLTEVHEELQKKQELIEDLQPDVNQNAQKINELEAALQKKDEDMKAMEERYKMYLEKARNVSDLSYSVQVFVTQVLNSPVPPVCTALVYKSCHLAPHYPSLLVRFLVCLSP